MRVRSPPHRRYSLPTWAVARVTLTIVAFTVLGSFPFILKVFAPTLYRLMLVALLGVVVLSVVAIGSLRLDPERRRIMGNRWNILFTILFGGYLISLLLVTFINGIQDYSVQAGSALLIKLFIAALLLLTVPRPLYIRSLDHFTTLMTVLAATGLVMIVLIALGALPVLAEVTIDTFGERDNGIRQFYGLGLGWNGLDLTQSIRIPRLQSYAAEAGNFAFALLIALVWGVYRRRWLSSAIMLPALMLTFSLGAFVTGIATILLFALSRRNRLRTAVDQRMLALGFLIVVMASVTILLAPLLPTAVQGSAQEAYTFLTERYLGSKIGTREVTSFKVRLESYRIVWERILGDTWYGLGVGGLASIDVSLALGWLRALIESGIVGWLFYLTAFGTIVVRAISTILVGKGMSGPIAAMVFVLASAALQRGPIDATVWHWWLLIAFFKLATVPHPEASTANAAPKMAPPLSLPRRSLRSSDRT